MIRSFAAAHAKSSATRGCHHNHISAKLQAHPCSHTTAHIHHSAHIRLRIGMHISCMYDVLCVMYQLNRDSTQVSMYNQTIWSILAPSSSLLLNMALITTGASIARLCAAWLTIPDTSQVFKSAIWCWQDQMPCFHKDGWTCCEQHHYECQICRSRNPRRP